MGRHLAYLKYILRHKWYVYVAARAVGASAWRAILHDLSKFRPSEWFPYAYTFYTSDGETRYLETKEFRVAWLKHIHRNPHHHQYWVLRNDDGTTKPLYMPYEYVLEMVADWMGAGKAITGKWEVVEWYAKNKHKIMLHPITQDQVRYIMEDIHAGRVQIPSKVYKKRLC